MIRLEMLKWKLSVERMLGSARNLERQRETYIKRAEQTGESPLGLRIDSEGDA